LTAPQKHLENIFQKMVTAADIHSPITAPPMTSAFCCANCGAYADPKKNTKSPD
jgi:hypothetical protein